MPRERPKNTDSGSPVNEEITTQIDTRTLGDLTNQLRLLTDKLDKTQRDATLACSQAKDASASAQALQIRLHELQNVQEQNVDTYVFKSKGNETQYKYLLSIIADITRAMTAFENGLPEEVDRNHKKAIAALMLRNKCVKIADNSPAGWALVEEYLQREAASDEEDDKRLRRAEAALAAKYKRKVEAGQRGRGAKRARGSDRGQYANTTDYGYEASSYDSQYKENRQEYVNGHYLDQPPWENQEKPQESGRRPQPRKQLHATGYPQRGLGPCFYCCGPHNRNVCPELAARAAEVQASIEASYYTQE
jgi:hypothetical protein